MPGTIISNSSSTHLSINQSISQLVDLSAWNWFLGNSVQRWFYPRPAQRRLQYISLILHRSYCRTNPDRTPKPWVPHYQTILSLDHSTSLQVSTIMLSISRSQSQSPSSTRPRWAMSTKSTKTENTSHGLSASHSFSGHWLSCTMSSSHCTLAGPSLVCSMRSSNRGPVWTDNMELPAQPTRFAGSKVPADLVVRPPTIPARAPGVSRIKLWSSLETFRTQQTLAGCGTKVLPSTDGSSTFPNFTKWSIPWSFLRKARRARCCRRTIMLGLWCACGLAFVTCLHQSGCSSSSILCCTRSWWVLRYPINNGRVQSLIMRSTPTTHSPHLAYESPKPSSKPWRSFKLLR